MNIIAIWERKSGIAKSKNLVCLSSDGRLLNLGAGSAHFTDLFSGGFKYDFRKAHFFMKQFGGILIWIQSLDADVEEKGGKKP